MLSRIHLGRPALAAIVVAAGVLVGSLAVPALGGPNLRSLVKKEVTKQLAGKTGPAGSQGPQGSQGSAGAAGADGAFQTPEAPHVIGAGGEPPFGNGGGDGDCSWSDPLTAAVNLEPTSFHKEGQRVYFDGAIRATQAGGGDSTCNFTGAEGLVDQTMFTLPAAYRPDKVQTLPLNVANSGGPVGAILVGSDEPTNVGSGILGPGDVAVSTSVAYAGNIFVLGSLTFLAKT